MRSTGKRITVFLALLCINACTTVQTQSEIGSLGDLSPTDNIVLLSNLAGVQDFDDDDVDDCLRPHMLGVNPQLRFMPSKQFRDYLYPYFTRGTTPHDLVGYKKLLENSEVRQRINSLGIRYLIILAKGGTLTDWHGGIFCGAGYGGGGCLGLSWWERKSELGLCVWDLRNLSHAGNIHVNAAGTGIMPAFGLPIPVYAPATKSAVCRELGRRLAKLLSGQE